MTNEWVKSELMGANRDGEPVTFTIADGSSVSKGDVLKLSDPATVTRFTAAIIPQAVAGIAAEEHVANQGVITIPVWQNGIFKVTASGALVAGQLVTGAELNKVQASGALTVAASGAILGKLYEDIAAEGTGEVRLNL